MENNDIFYRAAWIAAKLETCAAQDVTHIGFEKVTRARIKSFKENPDYGADFWRNVCALSDKEKRVLGFKELVAGGGMCLPLWVCLCLPDDMSVNSKKVKDLDSDSRFGCVALTDKEVLRGYEV